MHNLNLIYDPKLNAEDEVWSGWFVDELHKLSKVGEGKWLAMRVAMLEGKEMAIEPGLLET